MFTSTCPLKVKLSQGLDPFFQIVLLKTGRSNKDNGHQPVTGPSQKNKSCYGKQPVCDGSWPRKEMASGSQSEETI